jgi:DNA mismatch repair protein MutH
MSGALEREGALGGASAVATGAGPISLNRILTAFSPYVGRTLGDIADSLGIPQVAGAGTARPKHAASLLVRRVLGVMSDEKKLIELEALGVKPKTIPVRDPGMRPFEAMSFPAMSLVELELKSVIPATVKSGYSTIPQTKRANARCVIGCEFHPLHKQLRMQPRRRR